MNVITHALLPALLATPVLRKTWPGVFYREAGIVALGGGLPDILHPHLSLAARYASWTHTVFALAGFGLLLLAATLWRPERLPRRLALLAFAALALHLFGDAVSGGIAFFRPLAGTIVAAHPRWISHHAWPWLDAACILASLALAAVLARRFDQAQPAPG